MASARSSHSAKDIEYHRVVGGEYHRVVVAPRSYPNDLLFGPLQAAVPGGRKMLDLGCGTGHMLLRFGRQFKEAVGVDHSAEMLASAASELRRAGLDHVELKRQDLFDFVDRIGEADFDLVTCVGCIHHLRPEDVGPLIAAIARLLRPGGWLVVAEPIETPEGCPEPINAWNRQSLAAQLGYSEPAEEPDEAPIDRETLFSDLKRNAFAIVAESRSWEILPHTAAPGIIERWRIRALHRRYGSGGNVMALAAQLQHDD